MEKSGRWSLKLACASGICSCAGTGFLQAQGPAAAGSGGQPQEDPMPRKWIAALLPVLAAETDPALAGRVLKGAASAHYQHLHMDERIAPFRGNLDAFLA